MLLRGQNLLGYRNYADDVVEALVKKSVENGIDVLRIFDALNDTRNLTTSIRAAKEAGGEVQAAISYTTSDVHTVRYFVSLANEMARAGADSICIKDMAGVLTPDVAFELVSEIKASCDLPLQVHTHGTAGIAQMTYLKAVEAGADIIDTCSSPLRRGHEPAGHRVHGDRPGGAWLQDRPGHRQARGGGGAFPAHPQPLFGRGRPQPQGAGRRPQGPALQGSAAACCPTCLPT